MDNSLFDNQIDPILSNLYPVSREDNVLGLTELVLKYDKQKMQSNIILHDRNFGNANSYILDGRPCSTSLCTSGKFCDSSGWPELFDETINPCDNYFTPQAGRGEPRKYLQNIDIESRVRNIDYKVSKCHLNYHKDGAKCDPQDSKCQLNCHKELLKRDHKINEFKTDNDSPYEIARMNVESNRQRAQESKMKSCEPIKDNSNMRMLVNQPTKRRNTIPW
jgi:hypothetical protein